MSWPSVVARASTASGARLSAGQLNSEHGASMRGSVCCGHARCRLANHLEGPNHGVLRLVIRREGGAADGNVRLDVIGALENMRTVDMRLVRDNGRASCRMRRLSRK